MNNYSLKQRYLHKNISDKYMNYEVHSYYKETNHNSIQSNVLKYKGLGS